MATQAGRGSTEQLQWNQDAIPSVCSSLLPSPTVTPMSELALAIDIKVVSDIVLSNFSSSNTDVGVSCIGTVLALIHPLLERFKKQHHISTPESNMIL